MVIKFVLQYVIQNLLSFQSKALNATGKPIFFNACEGGKEDPWLWMGEYANSWRTGPDHHDNWESTTAIIDHNADIGEYARKNTIYSMM